MLVIKVAKKDLIDQVKSYDEGYQAETGFKVFIGSREEVSPVGVETAISVVFAFGQKLWRTGLRSAVFPETA